MKNLPICASYENNGKPMGFHQCETCKKVKECLKEAQQHANEIDKNTSELMNYYEAAQ